MVLCESIPTLGGHPVLEKDEPDADAMWEDETAWAAEQVAMPVLPDEWKTEGKSVAEQDADWYIRNEKRMAGLRAAEADWNRRNKRK